MSRSPRLSHPQPTRPQSGASAQSTAAAVMAVALVLVGLSVGPLLLLRFESPTLELGSVRLQLYAGFLYWTVGSALMVAPFLALMTLPGDWFERWWQTLSARVLDLSPRLYATLVALVVLGGTMFLSSYAFDRRPTTADAIAQLWHARILLEGRLAMPPDPNPEFFAIDNVIDRPLWMSQFPIGGPLIHVPGVLLGAPWLLNPIVTTFTALCVYRFARNAYGESTGRAAAAVFAVSPMILLMGATHMNHGATAFFSALGLSLLPGWTAAESGRTLHVTAGKLGASIGMATLIRPLDGLVAGAAIGLFMLAIAARDARRDRARSLLVAIGSGAVPVAMLLFANWRTTGDPLLFGYELLWGPNHSLGLHPDPSGDPHTPLRAVLLASKYALQLNWVATAWPIPLLLIVALGMVVGARHNRWDVLLLAYFCAQLTAYAFYWHDGQFVGPRFLYSAVPALLVLAARSPFLIADRLRVGSVWWRIAIVTVPVCVAVTWLRPMRPFGARALANEFRDSRGRFKLDPPVEIENGTVKNALVFIQEGASSRLAHRLWGLGVSRPDAARLLESADACTLLEAVQSEERRRSDTTGLVRRIESRIRPFVASSANLALPDPNLRVSDTASLTPSCRDEIEHDLRVSNTVAYGPTLLLNRFDEAGRIGGDVVYVMDLRDHNEVLRGRFGDRAWYRYELPRNHPDSIPVLIPYGPAR